MVTKIEINQHTRILWGKTKIILWASVIWLCGSFTTTMTDGSWIYNTTSTVTVKPTIRRLKEMKDQKKCYRLSSPDLQ